MRNHFVTLERWLNAGFASPNIEWPESLFLITSARGAIASFTKSGSELWRQIKNRARTPAFFVRISFVCFTSKIKGSRAPAFNTNSQLSDESPAMFPMVQIAYRYPPTDYWPFHRKELTFSTTSGFGELNSLMRIGIAPALVITWVCSEVPVEMFVNIHELSSCRKIKRFVEHVIQYLKVRFVFILHELYQPWD